jgi:multiple sugar transport system permease protein
MTPSRLLSAATAALLLATLALGVILPHRAVRSAEAEMLLAEAALAQQLLVETGDPGVVTSVLGDRWREAPAVRDALLDRPVLVEGPGGRVARAARYAPDRWTVVGALEVSPRPESRRGPEPLLLLLSAAVAVALAALAPLWIRWASRDRRTSLLLPALGAGLLLLAPLVGGGLWSQHRLGELTDLHLERGVGALEALPETAPVLTRPGGVARLTGLSFLIREPGSGASFSTLLPVTTEALAAVPPPLPSRATVGRAPWALADHGDVILARVPFEHTRSPWGLLLGVAVGGLLLSTIPVTLAPLAAAGRSGRRELRRNLVAWAFLGPAGVHLAIFTLGPLAFALWLSLHEWSLVDPARPFVGLAHYVGLLVDGDFWNAIANTALFTLHVPVAMAVALGFAVLVHRRAAAGRWITAVRAVLFLPTVTSLVAVAIVWQWLLNDQYGLINWALGALGIEPVPWLTSPSTALPALMLMSVWLVVGYQMVLFLAGLAAIPEELYEAARIDGAGPWSRFRHVTLPGLRHTLFFVLVTSVIGSFQVFGAVYVMTEGGPLNSTDVAVYHIYQEAWEFLRFGSAAAMSWILFALIFAVTWLHFRLLERRAGGQEAVA